MDWQEKFKSVLTELENKNEEYRNFYTEIILVTFEDIKGFLNENLPELIVEIEPYSDNRCYSQITIRGDNYSTFSYAIKIKETYNGRKILVKSSNLNFLENEEILLTKACKEGPTIEVITKEDIINDLINKFSLYQSSVFTSGFSA